MTSQPRRGIATWSLKRKLLGGVLLLAMVSSLGIESFLLRWMQEAHDRRVKDAAKNLASSIALSVRADLGVNDVFGVDRYFISLSQERLSGFSMVRSVVVDRDNRIVADTNPENYGKEYFPMGEVAPVAAVATLRDNGVVMAGVPLFSLDRRLGTLYTELSAASYLAQFNLVIWLSIAFTVVFIVLLGILIFLMLRESVIDPVLALSDQAKDISAGDFDRRIGIERFDEIGKLGEVMEQMRQNILADRQELERRNDELTRLNQLAEEITGRMDLASIVSFALETLKAYLNIESCSLLLFDSQHADTLKVVGAMGGNERLLNKNIPARWGVLGEVIENRKPFYHNDIQNYPGYEAFDDDVSNEHRAMMVIPVVANEKLLGVLSAENPIGGNFTDDHVQFLQPFASQLGVVVANAQMVESMQYFVPSEFLELLGKTSITDVRLGDQTQEEMTILFSDIRSFTALSEKMTPKENFDFINSYLKRMGPIIRSHNGFIDKYIGDAIMALFPGNPENALNAAIAMQGAIDVYNEHRSASGYEPIEVGIALHTGSLMLGTVGEQQRMQGTVISDAVNLTARMEELTKEYKAKILLSEQTRGLIRTNGYDFQFVEKVTVKGKQEAVSVYRLEHK